MRRKCLVFAMLGALPLWVGRPAAAQAEGETLHRLGPGESLADVAARFLGSPEQANELREFNQVADPAALREGTLLAIPGPIRGEAYAGLEEADAALTRAREGQAETYAPALFSAAADRVASSRETLAHANYAKALAQARLGAALAREAETEALRNANVPRDGRVALVHGSAELSEDGGETWRPVEAGEVLPIRAGIRTDEASRAAVLLEDGSELQVTEGTELQIDQHIKDLRTGRLDIDLDVRIGNVLGKIKPKGEKSQMRIKSGKAAVAVRGTVLRARTDAERTAYTEVLDGLVDFLVSGKSPVPVPAGQGVIARANRNPSPPIPLLPAPSVCDASAGPRTTAVQRVRLNWSPLAEKQADRYQVELARDAAFYTVVQNTHTRQTGLETAPLPEGPYYWRVTGVDRDGLVGFPSAVQALVIRKDLRAEIVPRGVVVQQADGRVAALSTRYDLVPAGEDTSIVRREVSVDGGAWAPLEEALRLAGEGTHTVRMRGVGIEGDVGPVRELAVRVDGTAPDVSLKVSAPVQLANGAEAVTASLAADDDTGVDRIEVSVDGGPFAPYDAPIVLSAYQDYRVMFRAVDLLGNVSPEFEVKIAGERARRGRRLGLPPRLR